MKPRFIANYSIFLFFAITGYWIITLTTVNLPEGRIEITFHVFSEILMALICLVSGILLIRGKKMGFYLNIAGLSMIIYSVLNAAGYFGERDEWGMTLLFVVLFLISSIILVVQLRSLT